MEDEQIINRRPILSNTTALLKINCFTNVFMKPGSIAKIFKYRGTEFANAYLLILI